MNAQKPIFQLSMNTVNKYASVKYPPNWIFSSFFLQVRLTAFWSYFIQIAQRKIEKITISEKKLGLS